MRNPGGNGFFGISSQDLLGMGMGILSGDDLVDGFGKGFGLVSANRARAGKTNQRKVLKDAEGYQRYADTGERVFPGVQKSDPALRDPEKLRLYQHAKSEGYGGNFMDFLRDTKGGTTVNNTFSPGGNQIPEYSKLPPGYVYVRDPESRQIVISPEGVPSATAVPGTPQAQEEAASEEKAELRQRQGQRNASIVRTMGQKAIDLINKGGIRLPVTGLGAEIASMIGGTESADMANILSTLKAKSAFGALQELRAASPTGGALGGVSEMELKLLQNAYGSLQQSQSPKQLADNIKRFINLHDDIVNYGVNADGSRRHYNPQGTVHQKSTPDVLSGISKKYGVKWKVRQ